MLKRCLWFFTVCAIIILTSKAKADAITLLPGTALAFQYTLPGNPAIQAQVLYGLNATGSDLVISAQNLSLATSGAQIISFGFGTDTSLNIISDVLLGVLAEKDFIAPGESGGVVLSVAPGLPQGVNIVSHEVVFKLLNGQIQIIQGGAPIPETATGFLLGIGLVGIAGKLHKRRKTIVKRARISCDLHTTHRNHPVKP